MKKIIILTVVMLFVASAAFAGISGTKHDLSALGAGAGGNEVCVYCHTPHNADAPLAFAPLWSHDSTATAPFTLYGSGTKYAGSNLHGTVQGDIGPVSKACMSCHDGTVKTGEIAYGKFAASLGALIVGNALLGTDLSNDHPVGITYQQNLDTELKNPATFSGTDVILFNATSGAVENVNGSLVECSSCHDVHDNTNTPFLQATNAGSALCLKCHTK